MTAEQVERLLSAVDVAKATGPNGVSLQFLKKCAKELSGPLSTVFTSCLKENKWSTLWKEVRVVAIHKSIPKSEYSNYRPIALISVVGKVLERIVNEVICQHQSTTISSHKDSLASPLSCDCLGYHPCVAHGTLRQA